MSASRWSASWRESRYLAEDALELIDIEFEPLPVVIDPVAGRAHDDAPLLHEEAGTNVLVSREFKRGDVDAALARRRRCASKAASACTARPRWRSSRAPVSPNTSRAATRSPCYSATQVPGIVRDALVRRRSTFRATDIRVVAPDVGGGFGGKGSLYPEEIFVCAAARHLGRSVKWTSDRMEDLIGQQPGLR